MDIFLLIFIAIIVYACVLFVIKKIGLGKKKTCKYCNNCCPDCLKALNRIHRKMSDHALRHITFTFFDFRRYCCNNCGWEGLRWEERFS